MGYTYRTVGSIDDYKKEALEILNPEIEKGKADINTISDEQKKTVTDTYNGQIDDTALSYEDSYRENAVQKLINEREVAENMANLGLSNSGLNRTQQTAVQLSYANNKASIDRQKQAAVDSLARSLAAELSGIETSRIASIADLESKYDQLAMEQATEWRNADIEYNQTVAAAEAEIEKAKIEAEAANTKAYYEYLPVQAENEQNSTMVSTAFYRGAINSDAKYGTFKNGYQPDNVKGSKLTATGKKETVDTIIKYGDNAGGKVTVTQNIWKDENDKEWIWDGINNMYIPY